jgi:hypothetical protein
MWSTLSLPVVVAAGGAQVAVVALAVTVQASRVNLAVVEQALKEN